MLAQNKYLLDKMEALAKKNLENTYKSIIDQSL